MSNTLLNIIIGLSGAFIGVLAFADEIGKYKALRFIKALVFKITVLVIVSIAGILATVRKDINAEIRSNNEQLKNDSLNKIVIDESNRKLMTTFTDALVKHGLKYDSTERKILTFIKDSSGRIGEKALMSIRADVSDKSGIESIRKNNQEMSMKLFIRNYGDNPAYNCNISVMPLVKNKEKLELNKEVKSNKDFTLSTKTIFSLSWELRIASINWTQDTLYLFTKGSYMENKKTNLQVFRELHIYDYENNKWKIAKRENEIVIYEALKKDKIF